MTDNKQPEPWDVSSDAWDDNGCMYSEIEVNYNEEATPEQITILNHAPVMLHALERLAKELEDVQDVPQYVYDAIKKARGL